MSNIGTGKGGKSFQDRQLAGEVRRLALQEIKDIIEDKKPKDETFRQAVILRMAGQILPRLNETTGPDGGPVSIKVTFEDASPIPK